MVEIHLTETDAAREETFTPAELRALRRARHGLVVDELADDGHGGVRVRIGPRTGYAGSVSLPGGRRITVHPKAEVHSLPELLALAYRTVAPPPRAGTANVESTTPTDWLLVQLAGEVHELLGRGLRRGYVERRERLPFVRGRTRPILNPAQLPFLDCEYTDFIADTPENQLLRGVLELLAPGVQNRAVRRQYDDALSYLGDVSLIRPSLRHFDRVRLNRLNQHYQPSLRLARLALEGAGVVDSAGSITAPAYFVLMWQIWENAAAAALRDAGVRGLVEKPRYGSAFMHQHGQPNLTVTIEPDLVIGRRQSPRMVIDLKWGPVLLTDRHGRRRLRNPHLYQIGTYATALDCDGLLLYPLMDDEVDTEYVFNGHRIFIRTVDLSQPGLSGLRSAAEDVAAAL
jgi:5-methylcytosine-specific restriction enzyme subunit McrC